MKQIRKCDCNGLRCAAEATWRGTSGGTIRWVCDGHKDYVDARALKDQPVMVWVAVADLLPPSVLEAMQGRVKARAELERAMRLALVYMTSALQEQDAKDRAEACEANGWRMSDASGIYTNTITTLFGLVEGSINPVEYLETAR